MSSWLYSSVLYLIIILSAMDTDHCVTIGENNNRCIIGCQTTYEEAHSSKWIGWNKSDAHWWHYTQEELKMQFSVGQIS